MAAFGKAVWRLHVSMFSPYEDWAAHQRVKAFGDDSWASEVTSSHTTIMAALLDLCTFFCLWTEAANLRHMPESIWFFYWCEHLTDAPSAAQHASATTAAAASTSKTLMLHQATLNITLLCITI